jgi:hypothetical protein
MRVSKSPISQTVTWPHDLINHHQGPGLRMLDTLHISKDADAVPLIQASVSSISVRGIDRRSLARAWLQQEDVCSSVLGTKINVTEDTGANACLCTIEDQAWVDIDNCGTLSREVSVCHLMSLSECYPYHQDGCLVQDLGPHLVDQIAIA